MQMQMYGITNCQLPYNQQNTIYNIDNIDIAMSFKAVIELFLQVHDFVNVDLPTQGIFRLRVSAYEQTNKKKIYGTPFEFVETAKKMNPNMKKMHHKEQIQLPYFYTKAGAIKYADERLIYNDLIRFRLELQSFPRLNTQNIIIQFELLFTQFCYSSSVIAEFDGQVVESKKFKLENLQHGILNYCEGEFIDRYSSKFSFTLFACLSQFKFGKYRLSQELEAVQEEREDGKIVMQQVNNHETVRNKELERCKVNTFDEMIIWVSKFYKDKVTNPLEYFYNSYVKNLRYYFYLAQEKLNDNSIIKQHKLLKVPKQFLQLQSPSVSPASSPPSSGQSQVSQKIFRKYMTSYEPNNLTASRLLQQINLIYADIFMFLMEVEKQFALEQLMLNRMKQDYQMYIKERYGERVFKSIVKTGEKLASAHDNKTIAKKMRLKEGNVGATYPIQDLGFIESKQMLEYLFYEINDPKLAEATNQNTKRVSKLSQVKQKIPKESPLILNQIQISKESQSKPSYVIPKQQQKSTTMQQSQLLKQNSFLKEDETSIVNNKQTMISNQEQKQKQKQKQQENELMNNRQEPSVQELTNAVKNLKMDKLEQNIFQTDGNEDIYNNICYEKGSVDSEMTDKSMDSLENAGSQPKGFEGISDIECKVTPSRKFQFTDKWSKIFADLPKLKYEQRNMLIVMCHGFQGSSYDMTILARGLRELLPDASYLLSRSNEGLTEGDVEEMGVRLAQEVQNYIKNYMDKKTVILNFIGHSMGGVVARTAVKNLLKNYFDQFGFFCSLSSPHLGYLSGVDGMIKAGLWAILKFKPIKSLQQLKMDDTKNLKDSFIYKLSKTGNLRRFRRIILFSSFEDSYVSWHSARISAHRKENEMSRLQSEMAESILGNQPVHRIDVNFNVKSKNLDSFIGRTAHINLIVQQSLFKIINSSIPELFDISKC